MQIGELVRINGIPLSVEIISISPSDIACFYFQACLRDPETAYAIEIHLTLKDITAVKLKSSLKVNLPSIIFKGS